ncbi:MAG: rod shape-determining protein [Clostridiales bacterium]|nr:rod shape-determining protein [Clostridiales bacterium]
MFGYDLGIDLGTSSVAISVVGKGVVLDEPSYVAYDTESEKVLYCGKRAYFLQGREPNGISVIQPILGGAVCDYSLAQQMLRHFISKVLKKSMFRPRVAASVPSSSTDVEKRILISVLISAGARSVCLIEEPLCAAFGAGVDPSDPTGVFAIDIGAGTTDMAVVSQGSMSQCETVKIAGNDFDEAIVKFLRDEHNLLTGPRMAEEIKKNIGSAVYRAADVVTYAKGSDVQTGLPKTVEISGNDICDCLKPLLNKIVDEIKNMFERTSPQLVADITNGNLILTGGTAQLYGIDTLISKALDLPVAIPSNPNLAVSKGCEIALKKLRILDQYGYTFKTKEEVRTR